MTMTPQCIHLKPIDIPNNGQDGARSGYDSNTIVVTLSGVGAGDLLITEVMPDPSNVSDSLGEWFEITNVTGNDINLNGSSLRHQPRKQFHCDW